VLAEKLPELLDFPKDLVSLEASTKVFFLVFFGGVLILWKQFISCIFYLCSSKICYHADTIEIFGGGNAGR
jgi:hypothetical protein